SISASRGRTTSAMNRRTLSRSSSISGGNVKSTAMTIVPSSSATSLVQKDVSGQGGRAEDRARDGGQPELRRVEVDDARVSEPLALAHALEIASLCTNDVECPVDVAPVRHRHHEARAGVERDDWRPVGSPTSPPDVVDHGEGRHEPGERSEKGVR